MKKTNLFFVIALTAMFFLSSFSFEFGTCSAQNVGINNTGVLPDASAQLDISSTTKGLLIPRVALTQTTSALPVTLPLTSLLVYNTATVTDVTPGYYYWDGTKWIRIFSGSSGSGTTDYLARWTPNGYTLGIGVTRDNNSTVGINTAPNAGYRLYVNGASLIPSIMGQYDASNYGLLGGSSWGGQFAGNSFGVLGFGNNVASSTGVYGSSANATGYGVFGTGNGATATGVYGQNAFIGATAGFGGYFTTGTTAGAGVAGSLGASLYLAGAGVSGVTNQATSYGVYGKNTDANGTGVLGNGNNLVGNYLLAGSGGAFTGTGTGVAGWATTGTNPTGVVGAGNNLAPMLLTGGSGGSFIGSAYGCFSQSNAANPSGAFVGDNVSTGNWVYVDYWNGTNYKILGTSPGTVSCSVPDINGNMVVMHAPESPEAYFDDYGQGQLINGKVHIDLDPVFAKNVRINEKHPLRVFVQLEGDCNGVYISNKTETSFDVIELKNGISNTPFQWHVVCNMRDAVMPTGVISKFEDLRFEPAPKVIEAVSAEPKKPAVMHELKQQSIIDKPTENKK